MRSSSMYGVNKSFSFHMNDTFYQGGYSDSDREGRLIMFRQILDVMNKYVMPAIVAIGFFGNLLSLIVFLGTYLRKESLSVYLSALAIADSGCLLAIFIVWLDVWDVTVFHTKGICQMTVYITYVCSFLSIWYVVSFMAERYIAVCFPLKRRQMCTTFRAKVVTSSLAAVALIGYSCAFLLSGVREYESYTLCIHLPEYIGMTTALTYIDCVVALLIPFLVLLGMNGRILHKIVTFYRNHYKCDGMNFRVHNRRSTSLATAAQLHATKLMLYISSVFVLINIPSYVIKMRLIVISFVDREYLAKPEEFLWQAVFEFVYYINFSINFFLYTICLKKFRIGLKRLNRNIGRKLTRLFQRCKEFCVAEKAQDESEFTDIAEIPDSAEDRALPKIKSESQT